MSLEQLLQEIRLARAELTAAWSEPGAAPVSGKTRRRLDRVALRLTIVERGLVQYLDADADPSTERRIEDASDGGA